MSSGPICPTGRTDKCLRFCWKFPRGSSPEELELKSLELFDVVEVFSFTDRLLASILDHEEFWKV